LIEKLRQVGYKKCERTVAVYSFTGKLFNRCITLLKHDKARQNKFIFVRIVQAE
jgi:hypothetical protein